MSARITACPKVLQCVPVSTTTRPVTVAADTAVKRASKGLHSNPGALAAGKLSSTVPTMMMMPNHTMIPMGPRDLGREAARLPKVTTRETGR